MIKLLRVKERKSLLLGMLLLGSTAVTMAQTDSRQDVRDSREKGKVWNMGESLSGEQLRRFHPTDLLKALQVMEPSLRLAGEGEGMEHGGES